MQCYNQKLFYTYAVLQSDSIYIAKIKRKVD